MSAYLVFFCVFVNLVSKHELPFQYPLHQGPYIAVIGCKGAKVNRFFYPIVLHLLMTFVAQYMSGDSRPLSSEG